MFLNSQNLQTFDRDEAEKLLEDDAGVEVPNTVSEYNQPGNAVSQSMFHSLLSYQFKSFKKLLKDKQQQQASAADVEVPNSVSEYNQPGNLVSQSLFHALLLYIY
jgi:hypothetical protein